MDEVDASAEGDPELQRMAALIPTVLTCSSAPSTVKNYTRAFQRWQSWAQERGFASSPARPAHFLLYLFYIANSAQTPAPVMSAFYGVQWMHNICGATSPTSEVIVQNCFQGLRRLLATTAKKKKAITTANIQQIIDRFARATAPLADLQMASLMTLGFVGFLRWDELHRIRRQDLQFNADHLAIFIESRKNDQFREGHWVFIANLNTRYCPVKLLQRFLQEGKHKESDFLFRKVTVHPPTGAAYLRDRMTYSRARERIREMLEAIGLNAEEYGLHSLRSGGATQAAKAGVPDRLFQRHGGWQSESSSNRYIDESIRNLLQVSRSLRL